ncbi:GNAT family N-acetyltransferase [Candidatus Zixiibacteriota bacterium]
MMEFETRPATLNDRDQLYELYASVLKVHITKIWDWDETWQQKDFDDHFAPKQIKIAVVNGQVVGYIHVNLHDRTPHVRMMCVSPEYQRKGIGGALLKSFIQECSASQQDVALSVFRINTDARRFYERLGFEVCGETETHYKMKWKV